MKLPAFHRMRITPRPWIVGLALLGSCISAPAPPVETGAVSVADTTRLMTDLRVLSADSMEGRRTGTPGSERARRYLLHELAAAGLRSFPGGLERPFTFETQGEEIRGVNLVGYVPGRNEAGPVSVVTAHYDHVGVRDGAVFNGADDNASGTAALLAITRHFSRNPPEHTLVIAALDAEEMGLRGAHALVRDPPVARERMAVNVNMDMVGRNARGELYAAGTYHYPFLRPVLERAVAGAPVTVRFGHDSPNLARADDWTSASDHGAFHAVGIPFVYFGVEDHPDYHRPTDDADRIHPSFFAGAVGTIIRAITELDANLEAIASAR